MIQKSMHKCLKKMAALASAFAVAASPCFAQDKVEQTSVQTPKPYAYTTPAVKEDMRIKALPHGYKHPVLGSSSKEKVGVALVCLIDASGSMDSADFDAQISSMAEAIASEDFRDSIFLEGGPQSVAITVAEFGSKSYMHIPWVDIRKGDEEKLKSLAMQIKGIERAQFGNTNQITGIDTAALALENCPWDSDRRVVDMITDGEHNAGGDLKPSRENLALKHGATLNALVILDSSDGYKQEEWSKENIRTQKNYEWKDGRIVKEGFVIVVASQLESDSYGALVRYYKDMLRAFKAKLRMEISYNNDKSGHAVPAAII